MEIHAVGDHRGTGVDAAFLFEQSWGMNNHLIDALEKAVQAESALVAARSPLMKLSSVHMYPQSPYRPQ